MRHLLAILGGVVTVVGCVVLAGWTLDIDVLKSVLPGFVTMKGSTAISFVLTGFTMLCFMFAVKKRTWAQVVVVVTCLWKLALMTNVLYGFAGGQPLEDLDDAVLSVAPGIPSLGTVTCFILSALVGLYVVWRTSQLFFLTKISGLAIASLGLVALVGYTLETPVMYYYSSGTSTAMAIHTAMLFVVIGFGFSTIPRCLATENGLN